MHRTDLAPVLSATSTEIQFGSFQYSQLAPSIGRRPAASRAARHQSSLGPCREMPKTCSQHLVGKNFRALGEALPCYGQLQIGVNQASRQAGSSPVVPARARKRCQRGSRPSSSGQDVRTARASAGGQAASGTCGAQASILDRAAYSWQTRGKAHGLGLSPRPMPGPWQSYSTAATSRHRKECNPERQMLGWPHARRRAHQRRPVQTRRCPTAAATASRSAATRPRPWPGRCPFAARHGDQAAAARQHRVLAADNRLVLTLRRRI